MKQKKAPASHPVGNRTVIGIICIVVALAICFGIAPLVNRLSDGKTKIVRLTRDISAGATITEADIELVDVGSYNLPTGVIKDKAQVVGKCALSNLTKGDYLFPSKIGNDTNNAGRMLESLDEKHKAISITIGSFALGFSGKLETGDIVGILVYDQVENRSYTPKELTYVKVITTTNQFAVACAASLLLMIVGCVIAIMIDNPFLVPVFAIAFAMIPFIYAKRTVAYYDNHVKEELETALSIITTSYVRTDDIVSAVKENIQYLKPPVKDIFAGFVAENMMISSDVKQSIRHLKEKVNNSIFAEWCETLIACQDDRTLKDTLMPIVTKLTDVRIVNNEIKGMLSSARVEYYMMAGMVVGNIPLLYFLNKDWFNALMFTTLGKLVLAICGLVIIVTAVLMLRFTKQIEYRK